MSSSTPTSGEPFRFEPFGDLAMIGPGYDVLLQRLCYVYHSGNPEFVRPIAQAAFLENTRPKTFEGIRWWRQTQAGRTTYLCVRPGELGFRDTAPSGPAHLVEELPSGPSVLPLVARVAIEARAHHQSSSDPAVRHILQGAVAASSRQQPRDVPGFVRRMTQHTLDIRRGESANRDVPSPRTERYSPSVSAGRSLSHYIQPGETVLPSPPCPGSEQIYQHGLFEVETDCAHFSAALAVFELQVRARHWIDQDAYRAPLDSLAALIREGHVSPRVIAEVGLYHFQTGQATLSDALDHGSLWNFQKQLYLALHHFAVAHAIGTAFAGPLPYSVATAEEKMVCLCGGLAAGLPNFYSHSVTQIGRRLADNIAFGEERALAHFEDTFCSEASLVLPRPFARMIAAFGQIMAKPAHAGAESELLPIMDAAAAIDSEHPPSVLFTTLSREYLILQAAKHLRLDLKTQQCARNIVSRFLVDRAA